MVRLRPHHLAERRQQRGHLRITVGTDAEVDALLAALGEVART